MTLTQPRTRINSWMTKIKWIEKVENITFVNNICPQNIANLDIISLLMNGGYFPCKMIPFEQNKCLWTKVVPTSRYFMWIIQVGERINLLKVILKIGAFYYKQNFHSTDTVYVQCRLIGLFRLLYWCNDFLTVKMLSRDTWAAMH